MRTVRARLEAARRVHLAYQIGRHQRREGASEGVARDEQIPLARGAGARSDEELLEPPVDCLGRGEEARVNLRRGKQAPAVDESSAAQVRRR